MKLVAGKFIYFCFGCLFLISSTEIYSQPIINEIDKLAASDSTNDDVFGFDVAISNNIAVVGAPGDDDNGHFSGSAYIFRFDCEEDVNYDNIVNVEDLLILIADWGSTDGGLTDINGDGIVNIEDLLMLVSGWGPC
jgi:hypothetical protein